MPHGAGHQTKKGGVRGGPPPLHTRNFSLYYMALSRVGTAATVIQRRLVNSDAGMNGPASGPGRQTGAMLGTDVISQTSVADAWEEVRIAVEALTFDPAQASAGQTPSGDASLSAG